MLNNESIDIINRTIEYLYGASRTYKDNNALNNALALTKVVNAVYKAKAKNNKKVNEYNKKNKKRHNLLNQLSYYRKTNNQAKVKELEEKLKENLTI